MVLIENLDPIVTPSGRKYKQALFQCECGNTKVVIPSNVKYGVTRSCGCIVNKEGRPKVIIQLSPEYKPIREHNSIKEAAELSGISPSNISHSMRNNHRAGGFYWMLKT